MATTEQLMTQFGVAWFGFDEASGNVIDKLGLNNYIGTVTGATRVGGWNGEGNAMSFDGVDDFVEFNDKIIRIGSKTIRMKIKIKSTVNRWSILLANGNSASGRQGYHLQMKANTTEISFHNSSNAVAKSVYAFKELPLEVWIDLMIVVDSTSKTFKLYANDELIGRSGGIEEFNIEPSANLRIARNTVTTVADYFSGNIDIDDLQIYNKALSPSDFTQKRLAVKAVDNKNLVLSPTSARVKEIPNTLEYMMLAQGGVVKEIDSAVDSKLIDFTKPTTEYEIVTDNKTPLGKGRMFTIPIGSDFKTAMIEDNY